MNKVLLIIPAFNERKNLPNLINKLSFYYSINDILVINDCSDDDTKKFCESNNIAVVNLPINLGIGGAVQTGFKYALENKYDVAVQVDGDGQHDPKYIKNLVDCIYNGNSMCIGSRFIESKGYQSTFIRRIGIKYFQMLSWLLTKEKFTDPTSGFRAFDKKAITYFSEFYPTDYPEPESIIMLSRKRMKMCEIPVKMLERENGKSSIGNLKSIYYIIKVTIAVCICAMSRRDI